MVLGKQALHTHGLVLYTDGYYDGYDDRVDPGVGQERKNIKNRILPKQLH